MNLLVFMLFVLLCVVSVSIGSVRSIGLSIVTN